MGQKGVVMKKYLILSLVVFLSGCGIKSSMDARNNIIESENQYKDCLKQNPDDIHKCDGYKKAFEADMQVYWGPTTAVDVNVKKGE